MKKVVKKVKKKAKVAAEPTPSKAPKEVAAPKQVAKKQDQQPPKKVETKVITDGKEGGKANREEKARLAREAVEEILKGIEKPGSQLTGTFVPDMWVSRYKPILGGYKKFILSQSDKLKIAPRSNAGFGIMKADDTGPPPEFKPQAPCEWKSLLRQAWKAYCQTTPEDKIDHEAFVAAAPKIPVKSKVGTSAENLEATEGAGKKEPLEASKAAGKNKKKRKLSTTAAE